MGVNVAFDMVDNTDDPEPIPAPNRDMMLLSSSQHSKQEGEPNQ